MGLTATAWNIDYEEAQHSVPSTAENQFRLDSFWTPPAADVIQADADEFARQFGLRPEIAEMLGLRRFLREDTLKSVH